MFLDSVIISLKSGDGGDGLATFRKEKFVSKGGPYGGSGGYGGDIIFRVNPGLRTLNKFRYQKNYVASNGEGGKNKAMHGANASPLVLDVPPGTQIIDNKNGKLLVDLTNYDGEEILLRGGRGGRGNVELCRAGQGHLELCELGEPGKELMVRLELKLLADVGIIGLPNAGKSTLLGNLSNAKIKAAPYAFTTLSPSLGIVKLNEEESVAIADIPGLIEGAHLGKGLGHQFLKHITRTKILIHLIDMTDQNPIEPYECYQIVREELAKYDDNLSKKIEIIVANKCDDKSFDAQYDKFCNQLKNKKVLKVSAHTKEGLDELLREISASLLNNTLIDISPEKDKQLNYKKYKFEAESPLTVKRMNDFWVVTGDEIKKITEMTNFSKHDNMIRYFRRLDHLGLEEAMQAAGVKDGDTVKIYKYEFEYIS